MYVEKQRLFSVEIFVVHGFDAWQWGNFYIYEVVPQKNLAPYMQ